MKAKAAFNFNLVHELCTPYTAGAANKDDKDEEVAAKAGGDDKPPHEEVYEGVLTATVRNVKILSLSSLAATVFGCPLFIELSSPLMVKAEV